MKKVIINADDFGLDEHTVEWTIKGFERGALTSATIMAGMPGTDAAIAYAKAHPQFSFGVHFYLVDETPMSDPKDIPSMIDPKTGKLWLTRQFILRNFAGLIRVADIVTEMHAQYSAIASTGLQISHVDGHGHNHRLPRSIYALRELSKIEGVKQLRVRRCQDVVVGREGLLSKLINNPMQKKLAESGFVMTDHFAMNAGHTADRKWFSHLIATLSDGVTEIGVHPGWDEEWRKIDTEDVFADRDWNGIEKTSFYELK